MQLTALQARPCAPLTCTMVDRAMSDIQSYPATFALYLRSSAFVADMQRASSQVRWQGQATSDRPGVPRATDSPTTTAVSRVSHLNIYPLT
jgi:hypothetical protein